MQPIEVDGLSMRRTWSNQTLQATAVKRLGWQVGRQRSAVPELIRSPNEYCSAF